MGLFIVVHHIIYIS